MKYIFIIHLLYLTSCNPYNPPHSNIVNNFTNNYLNEQKMLGFKTARTGEVSNGDIQILKFGFTSEKCISNKDLRKLIVFKTEELVNAINSDKNMRPYLHNYPFTNKNVHLFFVFENNKMYSEGYPSITIAYSLDGFIFYYVSISETERAAYYENYDQLKAVISEGEEFPSIMLLTDQMNNA